MNASTSSVVLSGGEPDSRWGVPHPGVPPILTWLGVPHPRTRGTPSQEGVPPRRDLGPVTGAPLGKDMGPVAVLWDGDGVPLRKDMGLVEVLWNEDVGTPPREWTDTCENMTFLLEMQAVKIHERCYHIQNGTGSMSPKLIGHELNTYI